MPIVAMGTQILKGTTAIGGLNSIGGLEMSADTIDTTTLDTTGGYRTFTGSFKDGGEVSLGGFFEKEHATMLADFESGTANAYTITFSDGSSWNFSGVVTGFQTGAELEDLVSFEATIKVSGQPTLTPAP